MSRKSVRDRGREKGRQSRSVVFPVVAALAAVAVLALGAVLLRSAWSSGESLPVGTNNVKGSLTAAVEVEDWSDFQCPHCKTFAEGAARQLEQSLIPEGKVKLVFRHMAFLGEESVTAAAASECAAEQGKFWEYHDKLFAQQRGRGAGTFSKPSLKQYGAQLGLDTASFDACVDGDLAVARVQAETRDGERKGVRSTPTIFVNGQKFEGALTWESLQRAIATATGLVPAPGAPRS